MYIFELPVLLFVINAGAQSERSLTTCRRRKWICRDVQCYSGFTMLCSHAEDRAPSTDNLVAS